MTARRDEDARTRLHTLRADLVELAETAREGRQPVELDQSKVGRLSRMDALQDQAMQVEVGNRRKIELQRIDAALARIDAGEYGFCVRCGDEIDEKRLGLDPAAPFCKECVSGTANGTPRP